MPRKEVSVMATAAKTQKLVPGEYSEHKLKDGPGELDLACAVFRGKVVDFKLETEGKMSLRISEVRTTYPDHERPVEFVLEGWIDWEEEGIGQSIEINYELKTRKGEIRFLKNTWNL